MAKNSEQDPYTDQPAVDPVIEATGRARGAYDEYYVHAVGIEALRERAQSDGDPDAVEAYREAMERYREFDSHHDQG